MKSRNLRPYYAPKVAASTSFLFVAFAVLYINSS